MIIITTRRKERAATGSPSLVYCCIIVIGAPQAERMDSFFEWRKKLISIPFAYLWIWNETWNVNLELVSESIWIDSETIRSIWTIGNLISFSPEVIFLAERPELICQCARNKKESPCSCSSYLTGKLRAKQKLKSCCDFNSEERVNEFLSCIVLKCNFYEERKRTRSFISILNWWANLIRNFPQHRPPTSFLVASCPLNSN